MEEKQPKTERVRLAEGDRSDQKQRQDKGLVDALGGKCSGGNSQTDSQTDRHV